MRENRRRNCRSLHYAPPDFLARIVALLHAATALRSGRDDKAVKQQTSV